MKRPSMGFSSKKSSFPMAFSLGPFLSSFFEEDHSLTSWPLFTRSPWIAPPPFRFTPLFFTNLKVMLSFSLASLV